MSYVELASKYITENDEFYQDSESMARRIGIREFAAWLDREIPQAYNLPDSIKEALNSGDGTYRP